jgi:hypothetical protein
VSAFHVPSTNSDIEFDRPLTFDSFEFKRTYCIVGDTGDVTAIQCDVPQTILVGNDWQQYKNGKSQRAWIGVGFSKFAFRVHFM